MPRNLAQGKIGLQFAKLAEKAEIREKTFGEDTAPVNVASEPKDPRSIFYINASRERRVEIVEIKEWLILLKKAANEN